MTEKRTAPKRIRISGLQEAQLPAVVELEKAATAVYYEAGFDAAEVPTRTGAEIAGLTRNHNVRVAEAGDEVAGYAAWRDEAPGVAYVEELSVHPDFQRFGVGTKLIETIQDEARDLGLRQIVLRCWTKAAWAAEFYKRAGFTPIDEAAPAKVLDWKKERSSSGRPFTRPGEVAMWAAISEPPAEPADEDDNAETGAEEG